MGHSRRAVWKPETSSELFTLLGRTTQCRQVFKPKSSKNLYSREQNKWSDLQQSQEPGSSRGEGIQCFSKSEDFISCFNSMPFTLRQIPQSIYQQLYPVGHRLVGKHQITKTRVTFFTAELASVNICAVDNSGPIHETNKQTNKNPAALIQE